jgi:hypothetical protein
MESEMRLPTLLLLLLTLVVGCASMGAKHSRTILMNGQTGERRECTVDMMRTQKAYQQYEECIASFEEQGYTIWGQY